MDSFFIGGVGQKTTHKLLIGSQIQNLGRGVDWQDTFKKFCANRPGFLYSNLDRLSREVGQWSTRDVARGSCEPITAARREESTQNVRVCRRPVEHRCDLSHGPVLNLAVGSTRRPIHIMQTTDLTVGFCCRGVLCSRRH